MNYASDVIRITEYMTAIDVGMKCRSDSYMNKYNDLIEYADKVRQKCNHNAALAGLSITVIQTLRDGHTGRDPKSDKPVIPAPKRAFIVRQFKRKEEIELMRSTYGRKFILVSAYLDEEQRIEEICNKIEHYDNTPRNREDRINLARSLVRRDYHERDKKFGQRVEEVFHLGDVFVPGKNDIEIHYNVSRFVNAFFGSNKISPNKYEYGMYTAAAAALRSSDLSRQVGAAIFTNEGEVVSLGCNEVPKSGGGTYWDERDARPARDVDRGIDANHKRKQQIIHDFIDRLVDIGVINEQSNNVDTLVSDLLRNSAIKDSQLLDIIEFGRMVHAEMNAITDAARLGRSVRDATLFCTTFPCHMCAKHIVSAGIRRVVFLEPYPKSYAEELHGDSITFDKSVRDKVLFTPFAGISPRRYRDIFEKGKRKDSEGKPLDWAETHPFPRVEDRSSAYLQNEKFAITSSLGQVIDELRA
ncbi:deoxycytidylate deaminase [Chelativorans sp. ZYF759]|uniref:anti-phage dCTP deaminase n=1 Tax=Chelativorans sp. ZYF759 TaxID=2692213 RepID=UPI00145E066E|nr:deoxycytidylate deaminase [Chelativorans sp. ZYF759]